MRMPSVCGYWLEHLRHPFRGGTEQAFMSRMSVRRPSGKRERPQRTEVRFGPAGWIYKDWEGIVYPKPKPPHFDQLAYIADFFDTVEINSSFYGRPVAKTSRRWVQRKPRLRERTRRIGTHSKLAPRPTGRGSSTLAQHLY